MMPAYLLVLLCVLSINSNAAPWVELDPNTDYYLVKEVDYLLDPSHTLTIDELKNSDTWQPITTSNVNFSFIQETLWLKMNFTSQHAQKWMLKVPYPLIDYFTNYSYINGEPLPVYETGDLRPFDNRPINHPYFSFAYNLAPQDKLEIFIKVRTSGASEVPIQFITEKSFKLDNRLRVFLIGWMNGILIVMMLYNLMVYYYMRDPIYLAYVATLLFYAIGVAFYNGTAFQYLWPNHPKMSEIYPLTNGAYHLLNTIFVIMLLNLLSRAKCIKYFYIVFTAISASLIPFSFVFEYQTIVPLQVLQALILNFTAFPIGVYYAIKGERTAQFFVAAWGLYILGMVIANLRAAGFLQADWFVLYVYQIGAFIQVSVLSIALADRIQSQQNLSINTLKRYQYLYDSSLSGQFTLDKNAAIIDANPAFKKMLGYEESDEIVRRSQENHQKYFHPDSATPKRIRKTLLEKGYIHDMQVQLKTKNGELKWFSASVQAVLNSTNNITSYQGSLIDIEERKINEENKKRAMRERMLAMEHLVVGICHEINTPLGISRTAISQLKEDFSLLNKASENNDLTKSMFTERLELEDEAIDIINKNLNRINGLISEFKEASVLQKGYKFDEDNLKFIFEEIELILSRKIGKENIKIESEKDIHFRGYPRAVMDLLTNLYMNSISHGFENGNGVIKISARTIKDKIEIKLRDNGTGIASHRIRDIFNPFYTSKRGSKGSIGLGLFQVFNIVTQLLDGNIEVDNVNPGVEFTVTFPIELEPIENRGAKSGDSKLSIIH